MEARKDALVSDLKGVANDADELMKEVAGATAEGFSATRTQIEEKLSAAKARLDNARVVAGEKVRYAAGATDAYVRENPWTVLGAAAAAGLLIGFLINRR